MLDPGYSSAHLLVEHQGWGVNRLDKTAIVADWAPGLHRLRVCQKDRTGAANCGTCEKCIRTMTALVALRKLSGCRAFPRDDVTPALIATLGRYRMLKTVYDASWYRQMMPALEAAGRTDLARAIEQALESAALDQLGTTGAHS